MLKSVKVGMIGCGGWGENVIGAYQQNPFSQIVALADLNRERAEAVANQYGIPKVYTDYREMLEKEQLDMASVAPPILPTGKRCVTALPRGCMCSWKSRWPPIWRTATPSPRRRGNPARNL